MSHSSHTDLPSPGAPDAHEHKHHVLSLKVYFGVWGALMVLTVLTVAAAFSPIEALHVPLALGIATVKAVIVALFFMHLLYDEKYNLILLISCFGTALLFFAFTAIDPLTRGQINPISMKPIVSQMTTTTLSLPKHSAVAAHHGTHVPDAPVGASGTPIVPAPSVVGKAAETSAPPAAGH